MERIRLLGNKIRIWFLKHFTNRVKEIKITDKQGKEHKVTAVQSEEKICAHDEIKQIHHITWKCMKCPHAYFIITQKMLVLPPELAEFADVLKKETGGDVK